MPQTYPKTAPQITPATLDDETLLAMARLIRATAEVENIVELFIGSLLTLSEAHIMALLGRSTLSRKIEIAGTLAKLRTDKAHERYKLAFGPEVSEFIDHRNVVAHGAFRGVTSIGEMIFDVISTPYLEGAEFMASVRGITKPDLIKQAEIAESFIPYLERQLKLEKRRAERLTQPLQPHAKAQPQGRAKQKPKPQS